MILNVQQQVHAQVAAAIRDRFGIADVPPFSVEVPPNRALGDLAVTVAFQLARSLRKAPKAIAEELAGVLGALPGVAKVVAAPNGYLNVYLDRRAYALDRLNYRIAPARSTDGKTVVEHTAINPNKAAHIGHLRNATLGDTIVRVLRFRGTPVETQNYIDDLGVQVADIIVGFREIEHKDLDAVRQIADSTRFDYYCWDLYSRVAEWYDGGKDRPAVRAKTLHDLEQGGNASADMAAYIVDRIVRAHLQTMARLNIGYDLLTYEGDILRLKFWAQAFEILKTHGAVFLQTEGKLAGCWVMTIGDGTGAEDKDEEREKVIVRSNGVVTYIGKDIANQFWKFGLLGKDFYYRVFEQRNGRSIWATTSKPGEAQGMPKFGRASAVYNVIDSRQSYLQQLLKQALATMDFKEQADHSTHFAYEMVALSHSTARALGYADTESSGKPFVEVSGRKGLGVKADDLIDQLVTTAAAEVQSRNPELSDADRQRTAEAIAIAAVRYFLVKFSRGKVIAFDIDEALSFEGETGPYIQYAAVRAGNIFAKLQEREGVDEARVISLLESQPRDAIDTGAGADELWGLVLEAARLDEIVDVSVRSLELAVLAKFAFGLAQAFNAFYHAQPILKEERQDARLWRAAAVAYARRQLTRALDLMGCSVPSRM
jgi:arginyl-tRNA synthetase